MLKIYGDPIGNEGGSKVKPLAVKEECYLGASRNRYKGFILISFLYLNFESKYNILPEIHLASPSKSK